METNFKPIKNKNGEIIKFTSTARNITETKNFENKLSESEKQFRLLFENMPVAYALHELITDEQGKPVDYAFLNVNSKSEELTEHKSSELMGKTVLSVFPKTENYWIESYEEVVLTGKPSVFRNY